jgi:hypothetical protein
MEKFEELSIKEKTQTNGGLIGIDDFLIGIATGAVIGGIREIIGDWEHFKDGLFGRN